MTTSFNNGIPFDRDRISMVPPSEVLGFLSTNLVRDLSTSRQKILYPSGALWAALSYRLLPGATATTNQFARVVINAASDADADGKLATDGAFLVLCQGDDLVLSAESVAPITRIDVIASAAVGTEKTLLAISVGVQS